MSDEQLVNEWKSLIKQKLQAKLRSKFSLIKPHRIIRNFLTNFSFNTEQMRKTKLVENCYNSFLNLQKSLKKVILANRTKAEMFRVMWHKVYVKMYNYSLRCKDL